MPVAVDPFERSFHAGVRGARFAVQCGGGGAGVSAFMTGPLLFSGLRGHGPHLSQPSGTRVCEPRWTTEIELTCLQGQ